MPEQEYRSRQELRKYVEGEDEVASTYSSLDELCDTLRERRLKRQNHEV